MKRTTGMVSHGLAVCALLCVATSVTQAATIIKLNLGGVGPDVGMTAGGVLSTISDGIAATTGDQNTDVEFTDFLDGIPDITTTNASFSLSGLLAAGPATTFGTLVIQPFAGGTFSLYNNDVANTLLLSGPLGGSALSGVIGPPGTGALFTTTLTSATGGTLASQLAPGSVSISMNLTNVDGGLGFFVPGPGGIIGPFQADAAVNIAANQIPEPATLTLLGLISAAVVACGRRRHR
jgi:hypothetical protein